MAKTNNTVTALRFLARANVFIEIMRTMRDHLHCIGGSPDPLVEVNRVIFDSFMDHVRPDKSAPTGFAYRTGVGDEDVRSAAEAELGAPVSVKQVVAVRRFMGSLFTTGRVTTRDVVRIRRMFFGPLEGE